MWLPRPLQDKVDNAGGDLSVLNAAERAALPAERVLTANPGIVTYIDPHRDLARVHRGGHGELELPYSQLLCVRDGGRDPDLTDGYPPVGHPF